MKVAVFQPEYPREGTADSAEQCVQWMQQKLEALQPGTVDLVLLPEYATTPGIDDPKVMRAFGAGRGAAFADAVAQTAKRLGCLVALPGLTESKGQWFNRTGLFDANGQLAGSYDKLHLPDAEKKDFGITPGDEVTIVEHGGVRFGFATCFDLYFPEYFAVLAAKEVDVVLCPSYQRSESAQRIMLIAQARALDTGAYVIRSSYAMDNPAVGGRSLAAGPNGELLVRVEAEACVMNVEFDVKRKFVKPASHGQAMVEHRSLIAAHRREDVYRI